MVSDQPDKKPPTPIAFKGNALPAITEGIGCILVADTSKLCMACVGSNGKFCTATSATCIVVSHNRASKFTPEVPTPFFAIKASRGTAAFTRPLLEAKDLSDATIAVLLKETVVDPTMWSEIFATAALEMEVEEAKELVLRTCKKAPFRSPNKMELKKEEASKLALSWNKLFQEVKIDEGLLLAGTGVDQDLVSTLLDAENSKESVESGVLVGVVKMLSAAVTHLEKS